MVSDADLDELERLERAATAGRWRSFVEGRDHIGGEDFIQASEGEAPDIYVSVRVDNRFHPAAITDADFIAAARNALPDLIAEVRRLRRVDDSR